MGNRWREQRYRRESCSGVAAIKLLASYDTARTYLAASTYCGEEVEIATVEGVNAIAAQLIQSYLRDTGINAPINIFDVGTFALYANSSDCNAAIFIAP